MSRRFSNYREQVLPIAIAFLASQNRPVTTKEIRDHVMGQIGRIDRIPLINALNRMVLAKRIARFQEDKGGAEIFWQYITDKDTMIEAPQPSSRFSRQFGASIDQFLAEQTGPVTTGQIREHLKESTNTTVARTSLTKYLNSLVAKWQLRKLTINRQTTWERV